MNRREFGRRAFQLAASLGMTSVSLGRLGGFLLAGCGTEGPARGTADGGRSTDRDSGGPDEFPDAGGPGGELEDAGPSRSDGGPSRGPVAVLIIGTGYGSAVTALRLTEAGIPVTMLEAGRLWDTPGSDGKIFCKPFTPDGRAMWFADKTEACVKSFLGIPTEMPIDVEAGVLEARGPEAMRVYQGKGVGGGSLVNMALYLAPEREKVKSVLPMVDTEEFFTKYIARAQSMLRAGFASTRMIESEFYRYSRVGMALAEKAGFNWNQLQSGYDMGYMDRELDNAVPRSALAGEAGFGNNYGKRSLDKTYLADALGTGLLTIHTLHNVKRIKQNPSGGFVVEAEQIDIKGSVLQRKEFSCTHLFMGAGSFGTSELLVRARERGDLPDLNAAVGTKWGPNGDLFVALDTPVGLPTGAEQCTIPSHCFVTRDDQGRRVVSEFAPLPVGLPSWQSFVIMLADNPEAGYFTYDAKTDTAILNWAKEQNDPSVNAAKYVFDRINAKAGTNYSSVIKFSENALFGDNVTYHPLGGVPLGEATDEYGRVREYPGLYVVDGSLIPVGIVANPSLSITALAERNIEHVLAADFAT